MKIISVVTVSIFMSFCWVAEAQQQTQWLLADILKNKTNVVEITGNPQLVDSPYGKAVAFNGVDDGLFLNEMPLKGMKSFTVEMIFKPEEKGVFEQRVLHIGESKADRMLLEIRAVENNWYFDGYAASRGIKLALAKENLIHPLGQWYHVAFIVTPNSLTTFVNGKQELQEAYTFNPIEQGQTSIGVRMNKLSWFKGAVYTIKISPEVLKPNQFLRL